MNKDKILDKRVDLTLIMSATMSNPQGNPDGDNAPRTDSLGYGFITPQGIKRKIRDYVQSQGFDIYVQRQAVLARTINVAAAAAGVKTEDDDKKAKPLSREDKVKVITELCKLWDNRAFGAVLTKPVNEPLTGPVQFGFARSVEPVSVLDMGITRVAVTRERDENKERTMGRLSVVEFGMYVQTCSISPFQAARTGFTWGDFEILLQALRNAFEMSKSSGRANMAMEKIVEFRHPNDLGVLASHKIHRRVQVTRNNPQGDSSLPSPHSIDDYTILVDTDDLPKDLKVTIHD